MTTVGTGLVADASDRSSTPQLGQLEKVPLREVWAHEAHDLTPWLLANAGVLSDALGMDLDLHAAEHAVGGFSLDLIGRDRASGDVVIVENQLETSDHAHLGQILTYAGGTHAANIVWVAPRFRAEHRAALEWLNERTDENTRFFAVQVDVVRIGDSLPAPLMTLVVRPNDWEKTVKATTTSTTGRRWTHEDLKEALTEAAGPTLTSAVLDLIARYGERPGASFYWGDGAAPSVTAVMRVGGIRLQPWSVYVRGTADGQPVWALNLAWVHKDGRGADAAATARLVQELEDLPGIASRVAGAEAAAWRRRPSIPAVPLLLTPGAIDRIDAAMAHLYDSLGETSGGPT